MGKGLLDLQCNQRNEMPYVRMAHVHDRFKHRATPYLSLNKLCSLIDRICKLCTVSPAEACQLERKIPYCSKIDILEPISPMRRAREREANALRILVRDFVDDCWY
jgi:hypothetical protein